MSIRGGKSRGVGVLISCGENVGKRGLLNRQPFADREVDRRKRLFNALIDRLSTWNCRGKDGLGERIRTSDLLHPMQVR